MNNLINNIVIYLFPEIKSAKEIPFTDYLWLLSLPSFGLSVLLFVALHI